MANIFRSHRLVYRAIEDNDEYMAFLHSLLLDSEVTSHSDTRLMKPFNRKSSNAYWCSLRDNAFLSVIICLPIISGTDDQGVTNTTTLKPIGRIGLWKTDEWQRHHRNSNIGIQIATEYQRKWYGSEAVQWILRWAFRMAGFHRVGIGHFSYNEGAGRLYERLGFVKEGRQRESLWYDGRWHDYISLGILESEWLVRYREDANSGESQKLGVDSSKEPHKI